MPYRSDIGQKHKQGVTAITYTFFFVIRSVAGQHSLPESCFASTNFDQKLNFSTPVTLTHNVGRYGTA